MRCDNCNSEWNSTIQMNNCPFCGASLVPSFDSFCEAAKYIIEKDGVNSLKDKSKTVETLYTIFKGMSKPLERFFNVAYEEGCIDSIVSASSPEEINTAGLAAVECLVNNFYAVEVVNGFIGEFVAALNVNTAPAPASTPVVEAEPMPAPEPMPEPMPAPEPISTPVETFEPAPIPEPIPEPEPMPIPDPIPVPDPISAPDFNPDSMLFTPQEPVQEPAPIPAPEPVAEDVPPVDPFFLSNNEAYDPFAVNAQPEPAPVPQESGAEYVCKFCGYKSAKKFEMCPNCYEINV